jgi:hypothetical protein
LSPSTQTSNTRPTLSWNSATDYPTECPSGIDYYNIYLSPDSCSGMNLMELYGWETTSSTSKTAPPLTTGETYYFKVQAVDNNGYKSTWSGCQDFDVCKGEGDSCTASSDCCGYTGDVEGAYCDYGRCKNPSIGTENCLDPEYDYTKLWKCNPDYSSCINNARTYACCRPQNAGLPSDLQGGIELPIKVY